MKHALAQKRTRELLALADPGNWHLISFFFHDRGSSIQKSVTGLLQELLYRLVEANEKLLAFIPSRLIHQLLERKKTATQVSMLQQRYGENQELDHMYQVVSGAETWSVDDLQEALAAITGQNEDPLNMLLFIDALDEHMGNHRELIKVIRDSFIPRGASKVNVKICLASRPDPSFANAFESSPGLSVHDYTRDDVQWYARQQLASSILYQDFDQDISELHQLPAEITQRANGVFIWVRIVIEELIEKFVDGSTISQLRKILSDMPEELKELYQRAVSKVKSEYALESYVMIQIVLSAKDPQTLESLLKATDVALQGKVEPMSRATMERRLRSRCGGLLEETSTRGKVQFLHQTTKTFFTNRHYVTSMFRHLEDSRLEDGSYYMLKYCIYIATRLPSTELKKSSETLQYLFKYAAESLTARISEVVELLECLIKKPRRCAFFPWELPGGIDIPEDGLYRFCLSTIYNYISPYKFPHKFGQRSSDPYHELLVVSLSYGFLSYAQYKCPHALPRTPPGQWPLLHSAVNSALIPFQKYTTLSEALKLVDWLLQKGADPNECCGPLSCEGDDKGPTALGYILSEFDKNPSFWDPLVAWQFILETIETLSIAGANPNMPCAMKDGIPASALVLAMGWPRHWDLENKKRDLLRLLIKYGADCHQVDTEGYRPLYYAIKLNEPEATKVLLQHGADPSDLGNGMNALQPESSRNKPSLYGLYLGAIEMQALLRKYSSNSERQSRRKSVTAEETSPPSHIVGEIHEMKSTRATEGEEFR